MKTTKTDIEPAPVKDGICFRLTPAQYQSLEAKAAHQGCSVHEYARAVTLCGGGMAPLFSAEATNNDPELHAFIRKVAWAVIVALSPELDEEKAEAFLKEYLP